MSDHEYTPHEALELIVRKITEASHDLGVRIREALNTGTEDDFPISDFSSQTYRRHRPYNPEEAIQVVLDVLESHMVETRFFVISAHKEFTAIGYVEPAQIQYTSALDEIGHGHGRPLVPSTEEEAILGVGDQKRLEIEIETETVQAQQGLENFVLEPVDPNALNELMNLLRVLRRLTDFSGDSNGDSV